jgi:uncharacterized membrane protein YphA (DoxX/SURF4 family)
MTPLFIPAVLITLMFFTSGFEKIYRFPISTAKFSKKMGLPLALGQLIMIAVIILELVAPMIIAAYTYSQSASLVPFFKLSVCALISFTIVATALYHNPLKSRENYYAFMSNLSTMGGLSALYLLA